jgi:hypothetical protein
VVVIAAYIMVQRHFGSMTAGPARRGYGITIILPDVLMMVRAALTAATPGDTALQHHEHQL